MKDVSGLLLMAIVFVIGVLFAHSQRLVRIEQKVEACRP